MALILRKTRGYAGSGEESDHPTLLQLVVGRKTQGAKHSHEKGEEAQATHIFCAGVVCVARAQYFFSKKEG